MSRTVADSSAADDVPQLSDYRREAASTGGLVLSVLDGTLSRVARRPLKVRAKMSARSAARGAIDTVVLELGDVLIRDLAVERLVIRAEDVRVTPGLKPRFKAQNLSLKLLVVQSALDRWTASARVPARLELNREGVVAVTKVRGRTMSEVTVDLAVSSSLLVLRPRAAAILGRKTPMLPGMQWYLPLPLPRDVTLSRIEPADGSIALYLDLPDIDEAVTAVVAKRLLKWLAPKSLRLGGAAVRAAVRPR